jgi:hypothetical protein
MTIETYLEHIFKDERGVEDYGYWDDWTSYACCETGEYHVHNNKLYKIKDHQFMSENDDSKLSRNKDGSISFALQFYNGGSDFDEELNYALDIFGD